MVKLVKVEGRAAIVDKCAYAIFLGLTLAMVVMVVAVSACATLAMLVMVLVVMLVGMGMGVWFRAAGVGVLMGMRIGFVMFHRKRLHIDTILTKYTIQHACQICKGYWKNI